jgi:hypothetical protein
MPDPHKDLAPIIEPAAPLIEYSGSPWLVPVVSLAVLLALVLLVFWQWRRRAPRRALRKLKNQSDPVTGANLLAGWMRRHDLQFDEANKQIFDRLRFGTPAEKCDATFARLCGEAEDLLRKR